ncbi:hypothetical protein [Bacillus safensis]|uniref:hypothetical protein n=1 Tax=Bacillus safensis TaxID=561879 RepID=UPI000DAC67CE|nr:hypothetical protein [Bacillus safensis]MCM2988377.1 hypothetical protein [Bacillus safensis]
MNKLMAILILGLGFSGAAFILSVPLVFKSNAELYELMVVAGSAVFFGVFAAACLVLRKRLNR